MLIAWHNKFEQLKAETEKVKKTEEKAKVAEQQRTCETRTFGKNVADDFRCTGRTLFDEGGMRFSGLPLHHVP